MNALSQRTAPAAHRFPVWKTINLGLTHDFMTLLSAMKNDAGITFSFWTRGLIQNTPKTAEKRNVALVVLSASELGFEGITKYRDICARAQLLGLELCPAEVGPALRLVYEDQPEGERLIIAMSPVAVKAIVGSQTDHLVYCLHHDQPGQLGLTATSVRSEDVCDDTIRLVFVGANLTLWLSGP